jgi:hypothetical protein
MEDLKRCELRESEQCILTYCKYVNQKTWETRRGTKLIYKVLGLTCIVSGVIAIKADCTSCV